MKTNKFFLIAIIITGSLFMNVANTAAQLPPIMPIDTADYHNGVEKYVGAVVPGAGPSDRAHLYNVGFVAPTGTKFGEYPYSLQTGVNFSISNVINRMRDTLFLTINFLPGASFRPFDDLRDVLTIHAEEASDFVLPLRGTPVPFSIRQSSVRFPDYVAANDTSDVEESVTIVSMLKELDLFSYSLNGSPHPAFYVEKTGESSGTPISTVSLGVRFTPFGSLDSGGTTFEDTLEVSHPDGRQWISKIPISGTAKRIVAYPGRLYFNRVDLDSTKTLDLNVKSEIEIDNPTLTDETHFSFELDQYWNPNSGGTVKVTFMPEPDSIRDYNAYLIFNEGTPDSLRVFLNGGAGPVPVLSASPSSVNFDSIPIGNVKLSPLITVILTNPYNRLTDDGTFSFANQDKIFRVSTVQPAPSIRPDTVYVTIAFAPDNSEVYNDTLIVRALYADDLLIPLTGKGTFPPPIASLSPQQATAISGLDAATTPFLSVKEGDIVVSRAPAGSSIQVYNLQGKTLKTQIVSSDIEILKTAPFPRSVYIVLVNDKKQVILRQKVVL
jgi:hypothetical protein